LSGAEKRLKIATSENEGEIVDTPTQTNVVSILQPRPASSLPFGVVATPGKSTIGNGLTIIGQGVRIISKGRLQIDGDIFGDLIGSDLTISADGSVIGTVSAERVNVFGRVKGEIRAGTVVLHPTARVEGGILYQRLEIADGAYFDGRVRRCRDVADLRPNLDLP
jgi:cytoskeletal protein CcmA (bactofilin family)